MPQPDTLTIRVTPRLLALLAVIADANTRAPTSNPNPERTTPGEPITLEEAASLAMAEGAAVLVTLECQRHRGANFPLIPICAPNAGPAYMPRHPFHGQAQTFGLDGQG